MAYDASGSGKRDRSPSFPYLGLGKALDRLQKLFENTKRHEVRVVDVAKDWGVTPKSSSLDRYVAALLSYGLIEDSGSGDARKIKISETGLRILEDKRQGVRERLLSEAALRPPIIAEYAQRWAEGRPDETHVLSQLKFEGNFTEEGARMFLRVFDETVRFITPAGPDSPTENDDAGARSELSVQEDAQSTENSPRGAPLSNPSWTVTGEREWLRGPLSRTTTYRLMVSGEMGPKEIKKLITLLEAQRTVLADDEEGDL